MPWLWSTAAASGTNVALFMRKKAPFFWVDHILGHWLGHLQWQGCFHSLAPVSSLCFQICVLKWSRGSPYSPLPRQPGSASTNQRWSARSDPCPEYGHLLCSKQTLHFCETPVCPSDQGLCTRALAGRGWLGLRWGKRGELLLSSRAARTDLLAASTRAASTCSQQNVLQLQKYWCWSLGFLCPKRRPSSRLRARNIAWPGRHARSCSKVKRGQE